MSEQRRAEAEVTDTETTTASTATSGSTAVDTIDSSATTEELSPFAQKVRDLYLKAAAQGRGLPESFRKPPGLIQVWDYAVTGGWTTSPKHKGALRKLAIAWAVVAVAVAAFAYTVVWSTSRPLRCALTVAATLLLGTAVAEIPVIGQIVPDLLTFTR